MADLKDMLNPTSGKSSPNTPISSPTMSELTSPRKKVKLTKDAAVFVEAEIRGECRFPPDEYQDEELSAYHQQFELTPMGKIAYYPRHIPYSSEKKDFSEKTGREGFDVFQYTFKVPDSDTTYTILWDYTNGLVKTTPLFKCTGYSKTTPKKVIDRNSGLKDICHSVTGGALVAQGLGYWVPMEAARAIAATFCYTVRQALTPVFGHNFPGMCLEPDDEHFGNMTINFAITESCTRQANYFKGKEIESRSREATNSNFAHLNSHDVRSPTPFSPAPSKRRPARRRKHKEEVQIYTSPYSSPYMTSAKSDDGYSSSTSTPGPSYRSMFTPVNTPHHPPRSVPYPQRKLPSPSEILAQSTPPLYVQAPLTPAPTIGRYSSPDVSPKTIPRKIIFDCSNDIAAPDRLPARVRLDMDWLETNLDDQEQRAVYALLSLKYHKNGKGLAQALGMPLHGHGSKRWTLPEGHFDRV